MAWNDWIKSQESLGLEGVPVNPPTWPQAQNVAQWPMLNWPQAPQQQPQAPQQPEKFQMFGPEGAAIMAEIGAALAKAPGVSPAMGSLAGAARTTAQGALEQAYQTKLQQDMMAKPSPLLAPERAESARTTARHEAYDPLDLADRYLKLRERATNLAWTPAERQKSLDYIDAQMANLADLAKARQASTTQAQEALDLNKLQKMLTLPGLIEGQDLSNEMAEMQLGWEPTRQMLHMLESMQRGEYYGRAGTGSDRSALSPTMLLRNASANYMSDDLKRQLQTGIIDENTAFMLMPQKDRIKAMKDAMAGILNGGGGALGGGGAGTGAATGGGAATSGAAAGGAANDQYTVGQRIIAGDGTQWEYAGDGIWNQVQ